VLQKLASDIHEQIRTYGILLKENSNCKLPPVHRSVGYAECDLVSTMDQMIADQGENNSQPASHFTYSFDELIGLIMEITGSDISSLSERKRNNIPKLLTCFALHNMTSMTLEEIGNELQLSFHAVAANSKRFNQKMKEDKHYQDLWNKLCKRTQQN
jgi:hypothetical protein